MSILHQLLLVGGLVCLVDTLHMVVVLEQKSNIGLFGSLKHVSQYYCLTYCSENNASEVYTLYSASYILYCDCAFFLHRYTATITVSSIHMTALRTAPMIIPATHGKGELFASHCASVITDVGLVITESDVGLEIWVLKPAAFKLFIIIIHSQINVYLEMFPSHLQHYMMVLSLI